MVIREGVEEILQGAVKEAVDERIASYFTDDRDYNGRNPVTHPLVSVMEDITKEVVEGFTTEVYGEGVGEVVGEYIFNKNLASTLEGIEMEVIGEVAGLVARESMETEWKEEARRRILEEVVGGIAKEVGEEGEDEARERSDGATHVLIFVNNKTSSPRRFRSLRSPPRDPVPEQDAPPGLRAVPYIRRHVFHPPPLYRHIQPRQQRWAQGGNFDYDRAYERGC